MIDTQADDWLKDLLPLVIALAREAGEAIMTVYRDVNQAVEYKRDNSPLTKADMASHHVILDGLTRLNPVWPVLSEESAAIPFDQRKSWRYFWMVDPLDGTKEFLGRNDEFTVNIALMACSVPILGVVYAPALDRMYYAAKGARAWRVDGEAVSPIQTARAPNRATRVVMSRSHGSGEENLERFTGAAENCEFILMGSSLKFCLVAEGAADIYPRTGPTMEWDTAAAHCILEEAGGSISRLDGSSIDYNKPDLRNPGFVAKADL
jgi:3'(2'), 5'-bisphosphate nucleotidase